MTPELLTVGPAGFDPTVLYAITFGLLGEPVRLPGDLSRLPARKGGQTGLFFDVRHQFRLVELTPENRRPEWRVSTVSYQYRLLDTLRKELLVWHWQPGEDFDGPDRPHLHVSAKLVVGMSAHNPDETINLDLDNAHLATGRVTIEAVIRTLIDDFQINPREGWEQILDRAEVTFHDEATQYP